MLCIGFVVVTLLFGGVIQDSSAPDRTRINIVNSGKPIPHRPTDFNAGPAVGNMLNNHFFTGVNYYNAGRYTEAEPELTYVVLRPYYLDGNPRRAEFMS